MQSGSDPAPMEDIMAHDHNHDHDHASAAALDRPEHELAVCPVMPRNVVVKDDAEAAGLVRDHDGERYWLCCTGCATKFDADPGRFAEAARSLPAPREVLAARAGQDGFSLYFPRAEFCTDNAAMIALVGCLRAAEMRPGIAVADATPRWSLESLAPPAPNIEAKAAG